MYSMVWIKKCFISLYKLVMSNNEEFDLEDYIESKNKSFDDRNEEKKEIHHNWKLKWVKVWQFWLCKIWMNIGNEMSKWYDFNFQRPVLIVSTFIWWDLVWVIPCSTQPAKNQDMKQFVILFKEWKEHWLDRETNFIINQFRVISIKRLKRLINDIPKGNSNIPLLWKEQINLLLEQFSQRILFKKN